MGDMEGETSFATYDEKRVDEFARDVTAFQKKIDEQKKQIAALQASLEHETQRAQAAIQERDAYKAQYESVDSLRVQLQQAREHSERMHATFDKRLGELSDELARWNELHQEAIRQRNAAREALTHAQRRIFELQDLLGWDTEKTCEERHVVTPDWLAVEIDYALKGGAK